MYQQLWGYKVEEKLYLGVREDTLRFSFLSFKTYYLIHYFGCNLFYLF
jgi:hypothetical protein